MNSEASLSYRIVTICFSLALGFALEYLCLDESNAILLSIGAAILLSFYGYVFRKKDAASTVIAALLVVLIPLISLETLRETDEACDVIGRFRQSGNREKNRNSESEKIQIKCPDGIYERSIWVSDRYDLRVGDKLRIRMAFTGIRKL